MTAPVFASVVLSLRVVPDGRLDHDTMLQEAVGRAADRLPDRVRWQAATEINATCMARVAVVAELWRCA